MAVIESSRSDRSVKEEISQMWNDTIGFETNENCVPKWIVNNGDNNDIIEKNRCDDRKEYKQSRTSL